MEILNMKPGGKRPFKRFVKWFVLIVLALIVFYAVIIFSNATTREWVGAIIGQKLLQRSMDQYAREIKADKYGGKTPEETYAMFVEALKKEDIDLAVKYFVKEEQSEYKKMFEDIKKNGKWDMMMKDVLAERNQDGRENGKGLYTIEVTNEDNFSTATVSIILPQDLSGNFIGDIWKIDSF